MFIFDPDQIRIRPKVLDHSRSGSGSTTLIFGLKILKFCVKLEGEKKLSILVNWKTQMGLNLQLF